MKKIFILLLALCAFNLSYSQSDMTENRSSGGRLRTVRSENYYQTAGKLRISFDVGYTCRTARFMDELSKAVLNKNGIVYGADIHYFHSENGGIGVKFIGHGYSSDVNVNTIFIGPSIISKKMTIEQNGAWISGFSVGYVSYKEKIEMGTIDASYSKGGFGLNGELGYDFRMDENLFWGVKISFFTGLVIFDNIPGMETKKNNLSAIDISTGIRF